MYSNIEAHVLLAKCSKFKKIFGVRMERLNDGWKYNWAFEVSESRAKTEKYSNTVIKGKLYPDPEYPGCPYCGAKRFIICSCGRLNCSNSCLINCGWCGVRGTVVGEYPGFGLSSFGDI